MSHPSYTRVTGAGRAQERLLRAIPARKATRQRTFQAVRSRPFLALLVACLPLLLGNGGEESGGRLLESVASWPGYGRGPAMAVAVDGDYAYVAAGAGGLIVLDVSAPAQPVRVGSYWASGETRCVQISGSRAYVGRTVRGGGGCIANRRGRLDVLDVSDPAKPTLLGSHPLPRSITDLQIVGHLAYVATLAESSSGLEVLDVSDPARLVGLGERRSSNSRSVRVDGQRVCAMGVGALDVGDADPARTGWESSVAITNVVAGGAVWLQSNYAYVSYVTFVQGSQTGQDGVLECIDLRPPATSVGRLLTDEPLLGLQVVGSRAYAPAGDGGLLVFEVGDPKAPKAIGRLKTAGCAVGVTVAGRYAYVAGYEGGLHIVDVSEPARPVLMGTYETGLTTRQVHVEGGRALLVSSDRHESGFIGQYRLELVDMSDPSVPTLLGSYESPGTLKETSFSATLSCLLLEDGPLEVVDWSDPSRPKRTGTNAFDGVAYLNGLSSSATHVYLADGVRLKVFDLTTPATPRLVSELVLPDYIQGVRVRGNRAYVAFSNGIRILDVSNPAKPVAVGAWLSLDGNINGSTLDLGGSHAYLNTYEPSLLLLDIGDPNNPFLAGTYSAKASVVSVAAEDRYTYLAEGSAGIEILDVADPAQPLAVPGWSAGGSVNGIQAEGGLLYVAEGGLGLVVLKTRSDLAIVQPPKDQTVGAAGPATLEVSATGPGPLGYQWYLGLTGDTSKPIAGATARRYTLPEVVGDTSLWVRVSSGAHRVDSPTTLVAVVPEVTLEQVGAWPGYRMGQANAVSLFGNYACVAAGSAGLMMLDINNPTAPQRVGGYETGGEAVDVAVVGQHAFVLGSVCCDSSGITLFDLGDPTQPRKIGAWTTAGSDPKFSVRGNLAGVVKQTNGNGGQQWSLDLIDLSTPQDPQAVGRYTVTYPDSLYPYNNRVSGVVLADNHAYLAKTWRVAGSQIERGSLDIVNISNPAQPRLAGSYAADQVSGLAVQGSYAVLTERWWDGTNQGSLEILDISSPGSPQLIVRYPMPGGAYAVSLDWPRAYVSTAGQLVVLDLSNPAQPKQLSQFPGGVSDVGFGNGYAYLAVRGEGLRVLDVSNPAQPTQLGSFDTERLPLGIQVKAPYAYVAYGDEGLRVLDVSNPAQPVPIGLYNDSYASSVVCDGGYAYVGDGVNLTVLDLSDPAHPRLAGSSPSSVGSRIRITGQYACIAGEASGRGGLEVVDLSNPASLRLVSGYGEWAGALGVLGQYAYVAAGDGGLGVFDLGIPTAPRRVGLYYPTGRAEDIVIREKHAYLAVSRGDGGDSPADTEGGLEILDLSDPTRPRWVGASLQRADCRRIDVDGRLAAVVIGRRPFSPPIDTESVALLDLGRPAQPVVLARTLAPEATEVAVSGDTVYLAQGSYGFTIWRITSVFGLDPPVVSGGMLRLSWRGGPGPRLQRASRLDPAAWDDVAGSELVSRMDLALDGAASFFRLIKR